MCPPWREKEMTTTMALSAKTLSGFYRRPDRRAGDLGGVRVKVCDRTLFYGGTMMIDRGLNGAHGIDQEMVARFRPIGAKLKCRTASGARRHRSEITSVTCPKADEQ